MNFSGEDVGLEWLLLYHDSLEVNYYILNVFRILFSN